jgi:hypothetical protein
MVIIIFPRYDHNYSSLIMINNSNADLADLINKHLHQTLNAEERERLQHWLKEHDDNRKYFEKITAPGVIKEMAKHVLEINVAAIHRKFKKRGRRLKQLAVRRGMLDPGSGESVY